MPIQPILLLGNPILCQPCAPVTDVNASDTRAAIQDLNDTLAEFRRTHGFGRAIAAPQIGVLQRILFVQMQPTGFCGALINPTITHASADQIVLWDDCFSFPDLLVQVERAQNITVAYTDEAGQPQTLHAEGDLSELLQHEIDHLDGILAVQRAIHPQAFALRSEWEKFWRK
jgi:peptide deformylase